MTLWRQEHELMPTHEKSLPSCCDGTLSVLRSDADPEFPDVSEFTCPHCDRTWGREEE